LHNRLVNLNVDLKLARNEASHERVTALEIEIDVMKADKNVLEPQTAEQRVAAYARKCAEKEAEEETQRAAKVVERDRKRRKGGRGRNTTRGKGSREDSRARS
jgi:hypothetical protein